MNVRDESGFTLIELLLVMTIAIIILGTTLTTFNQAYQAQHDNDQRNDSAERAREALDVQARQLRNLAKRVNNARVIDTLSADNLIFQTSDPQKTWVRYCLDTSAPGSPSNGRIWMGQLAGLNPAVPPTLSASMKGACPGTGWTQTRVVAQHVTNRRAGLVRPLFTYTCTDATAACTASTATYDQVVSIAAQTLIDTRPNRGALELRVATAVHLRNQNQAPVALFTATPSGSRTVVLNASGTTDFENRTLSYYWFKKTLPTEASINCTKPPKTAGTAWDATFIGSGVTFTHKFPIEDGAAGTNVNVALVACDPGDRYGTAGIVIPPRSTIAVAIPN